MNNNIKIFSLVVIILSVVFVLLKYGVAMIHTQEAQVSSAITRFPKETEVGVWMWQSPEIYLNNRDTLNKDFNNLKSMGINTVYIRIDEFIDLSELTNKKQSESAIYDFTLHLKDFVILANSYGIKTYALAGSDSWEQPDYSYIPVELIKFIVTYNQNSTPEEKVLGIHFDIEPYSSKRFAGIEAQKLILQNFLTLNEEIVNQVLRSEPDLYVGITVPYWLDNVTRDLPQTTRNQIDKPAVFHIIDILNRLKNGQLIVMAYRNFANGENGTLDLVKEEINYADTHNVKVIVAQETLNYSDNSKASFYGLTLRNLFEQSNMIDKNLREHRAYGGIAIHHLDSLLELSN